MKKFATLPLIAALALGSAACSKSEDAGNVSVANDVTLNTDELVTDENSAAFDANATALDEGNVAGADEVSNATETNTL